MESKTNEATPLRPDGERVIDAAVVQMDLNKFISQIKSETTWKEGARNSITILKNDSLRLVLIGLHAKAELREHKTETAMSLQVLQGKIQFNTQGEIHHLAQGQMISLREKIPHSVLADEESFMLLTVTMK